jgi:hypothetical protein
MVEFPTSLWEEEVAKPHNATFLVESINKMGPKVHLIWMT